MTGGGGGGGGSGQIYQRTNGDGSAGGNGYKEGGVAGQVVILSDGYRIVNTGGQGGGGDADPAGAAGANNGANYFYYYLTSKIAAKISIEIHFSERLVDRDKKRRTLIVRRYFKSFAPFSVER
jgi:hypothetical protein